MIDNLSFIVNVNKPEGITSFDVVSRIRRLFKIKRVGHCGTLDPFASGVLPVCVGKATAAVHYMDSYDKGYKVSVVFGKRTDTQDKTGAVVEERQFSKRELDEMILTDFAVLRKAAEDIKHITKQTPPMYSAIKKDGIPLYKLARQGIEVERNARDIKIHEINITGISTDENFGADIEILCSKGTYIRTICDDLGLLTGYLGYAKSLCRTSCGPYKIQEAADLQYLENKFKDKPLSTDALKSCKSITDIPFALSGYKSIVLSRDDSKKLIQGQKIRVKQQDSDTGPILVYDNCGIWIGVAKNTSDNEIIKAERIFVDVQNY